MRFANAPISYGVFGELSVTGTATTKELLNTMAQTGYDGSELGPPGFFGPIAQMTQSFSSAGLTAVGAYVPLNTQQPGPVLERDLKRMNCTFNELVAANPDALAILADEGSAEIMMQPRKDPAQMLDATGWRQLIDTIQAAANQARGRGLEVSYHPHICTYVELPEEIDRFLNDTDISLTYDIGHIVLAGGDGIELYRRWKERINHVHLKDVLPDVLEEARLCGADFEQWFPHACTLLGEGQSQLEDFAAVLKETDYNRWVVVEQDCEPLTPQNYPQVIADQQANFDWLQRHLGAAAAQ